jgi:AcrR family transcriptional regulator
MIELVAADGYKGVTVRKLTKLARVSPRVFYGQFDGVEECFVETYESLMDEVRGKIITSRLHRKHSADQARRALAAMVEGVASDSVSVRFLLVGAYGGGPAALARIRTEESGLGAALRECVSRRGERVTPGAANWVVSGALRLVRTSPTIGEGATVDPIVAWASPLLDPAMPDLSRRSPQDPGQEAPRQRAVGFGSDRPVGERELLLSAGFKVARSEGYWGLSISKIRTAAGLSRACFDRHFASVEGCYLASISAYCRRRLLPILRELRPTSTGPARTHREVRALCGELAADPPSARLAFAEILAPGAAGLDCRESLITELASAWRESLGTGTLSSLGAEATVAGLWSALESGALSGASPLPGEAATLTFLLLSPLLGAEAAKAAVRPSGRS